MTTIPTRRVADLCDALTETSMRLATLMRAVTAPEAQAVGVWTIGDTAQHVSGSAAYFAAAIRGEVAPERLDDVDAGNARTLAEDPERDPRVLADVLTRGADGLIGHARHASGDPVVTPFADVEVPLSTALAVELGEELVHGFDIARAARLPWRIEPRHAALTLDGYLPLLPYVLNRGAASATRLAIDLRVRGATRVVVAVDHGSLTVSPPCSRPVDCHVAAGPVSYLLLSFNRIPPWSAVLRGDLFVWGRRPWRAAEFSSLLAI